jgi:hypothetical protein
VALALSPARRRGRGAGLGRDRSGGGRGEATGIELGEPLVTLDAAAAEAGSSAALGRGRDGAAVVAGAVAVEVVERRAVAAVLAGDGSEAALVDEGGRVLEAVPTDGGGRSSWTASLRPGHPGTLLAEGQRLRCGSPPPSRPTCWRGSSGSWWPRAAS